MLILISVEIILECIYFYCIVLVTAKDVDHTCNIDLLVFFCTNKNVVDVYKCFFILSFMYLYFHIHKSSLKNQIG